MAKFYKVFLILGIINYYVGAVQRSYYDQSEDEGVVQDRYRHDENGAPERTKIKRWRVDYKDRVNGRVPNSVEMTQQEPGKAPPKPPRGIPRDFDELIDGSTDEDDMDYDMEDEEDIKCVVDARRPYGVSPKITLTNMKHRFNSLLIGYDTHGDEKRSNKSSLYGWSSPKIPNEKGVASFTFDIDYASILPQGGQPLSYCALVFSPPVVPKFDMRSVFGKPVMSMERYIGSEEHLVKALKKKNRKVTSCCFVAYPMVSRR